MSIDYPRKGSSLIGTVSLRRSQSDGDLKNTVEAALESVKYIRSMSLKPKKLHITNVLRNEIIDTIDYFPSETLVAKAKVIALHTSKRRTSFSDVIHRSFLCHGHGIS